MLLSSAFIGAFLTRSVIQWQMIPVFAASLVLFKIPWSKIAVFVIAVGIVVGGYTLKQYHLFGITMTSSFAPFNLCRGIGNCHADPARIDVRKHPRWQSFKEISVLTRKKKVRNRNFNHLMFLEKHDRLQDAYYKKLRDQPLSKTLFYFTDNVRIYFKPSADYISHKLVDPLPWREVYNWCFSGISIATMLLAALVYWIATHRASHYRRGVGMLLPAIAIFAVCVLFERGENMRFKFFLEPVLFVFIASQVNAAIEKYIFRRA